jgi:hypothetical protein
MSKGGLDKKRLMNELSSDELKAYLNGIIDAEIKKPVKKIDSDTIDECVNWLIELNGQEVKISEETIKQRAKSIIAEHYKPKIRRFNFKSMRFAMAACILVLLSVQFISFTAFSINFFDWTKNTFLSLIGVEIQENNREFTASDSREYKTIEEFRLAENIEIVVPTWLPDGIEIKSITYSYEYKEQRVNLTYSDDITSLTIKLNSPVLSTKDAEIHENSNTIFYVFADANTIWWEYNGDFYSLICGFNINKYAERVIENIK